MLTLELISEKIMEFTNNKDLKYVDLGLELVSEKIMDFTDNKDLNLEL